MFSKLKNAHPVKAQAMMTVVNTTLVSESGRRWFE
jgi:hypothetical protein